MKRLKRFFRSGTMVTLVWVLGIAAIWEGFAYYVAQTKRTPLNVLPHLWQIIGSFFSDKMITGQMTMIQLIGNSCAETLSRAAIHYLNRLSVYGIGKQQNIKIWGICISINAAF